MRGGEKKMKKHWKKPTLEILDITQTMGGNGKGNPDCFGEDDDFNFPDQMNNGQYKKYCAGS